MKAAGPAIKLQHRRSLDEPDLTDPAGQAVAKNIFYHEIPLEMHR